MIKTGFARCFALGLWVVLMGTPDPAAATGVDGVVRGGGQAFELSVVALRTRNLRESGIVAAYAPVDSVDGVFHLTLEESRPLWLMVTTGCSDADLRAERLYLCRAFFPRHEPVRPGASDVLLQVPDLALADALWSGAPAPPGPYRGLGAGLLLALLLLAAWLWRRPMPAASPVSPPPRLSRTVYLAFALAACALLLPRLGSEPLDLLEYSYFHEGVRPDTATAVLSDFISAELAHGPVEPLLLRAMHALSPSPWLLRLPSALFGVLFVLVVVDVVRREAGRLAAVGAGVAALTAPAAVYYARDATPYALAGLCAAASIWLLLRARDADRAWPWWALFAATHVLGFFSHYGFAAVSLAQALALLVSWRRKPRALSAALLAFAGAGVLPVLLAPHLAHMMASSGVRFSLMSSVYPESPGLVGFAASFLAVLTSLPSELTWGLLLTLPLWALGLGELARRSPLLAWIVGLQALLLLVFLVFTHTMSTTVGGDHVFYAYRWTRPLLLGLIVPLGVVAVTRARWGLAALVCVATWQCLSLVGGPTRPAQEEARAIVEHRARPGDAYAVLPAAFYGDPLQYHLAAGAPPELITRMQPRELPVGGVALFGPLADGRLTLETEIDRLHYERVWIAAYREAMFGTPKFAAGVTTRTLAALDRRWRRDGRWALPFLDLYLYTCAADCAWAGAQSLLVDLSDPLRAARYLAPGPGDDSTLRLVLPGDARRMLVRATWPAEVDAMSLAVTGARVPRQPPLLTTDDRGYPRWELPLSVGEGRTRLTVTVRPPLRAGGLIIEASR